MQICRNGLDPKRLAGREKRKGFISHAASKTAIGVATVILTQLVGHATHCPPVAYPVVSRWRIGRASLGSTCNVRFQNRGFILNGTDETVTEGKTLTNESLFSPACLHD
jgi:hypothetical protein